MIDYRVRSVSLLSLVNEVRAGRLIPDAYFQRNLVWRDIHKKDFIKTILLGLPFPQIFISKGKVDVEKMTTISCIVDGQQRTNAITEFVNDKFDVDDRLFSQLSGAEKSDFLKYEIAVIELELENDNPKVQEIFQRINRTSNSLTSIEKMASQYGTSEFMLAAKLLADEVDLKDEEDETFRVDPNIPKEFFVWAKTKRTARFIHLLTEKGGFSPRELSKKAHLMHVLNMMSTLLTTFYNRNDRATELLDDYAQSFPDKDKIVDTFETAADIILRTKLRSRSYWYNKANLFSLLVATAKSIDLKRKIDPDRLREQLLNFEENIPEDYKLAATEAVNSTRARVLRNRYVSQLIDNSIANT